MLGCQSHCMIITCRRNSMELPDWASSANSHQRLFSRVQKANGIPDGISDRIRSIYLSNTKTMSLLQVSWRQMIFAFNEAHRSIIPATLSKIAFLWHAKGADVGNTMECCMAAIWKIPQFPPAKLNEAFENEENRNTNIYESWSWVCIDWCSELVFFHIKLFIAIIA